MKYLTTEDFYKFIITLLEELKVEVVTENPNGNAIFPCIVAQAPIRIDEKIYDRFPILTRFSITCEAWTKSKMQSIILSDKIDQKLREYNFRKIGSPIDSYDEITKCQRYGGTYEVLYNALTNSFEKSN